ncbi:MAG: exodeoxyribonuclease VII large subunit [Legionellales bacterium]|nr:exodeoxyribonuclease VII large subunit [Legionellales bacterium]OUX66117.1 MAG: exodeoxyribonuclease VII large subunit [Gammaproteobacteria bacterium TMED281]|tara:strand:+ start:196 stop:1515 length:1320 start_codon:yes stop_codon:yes gene_type:complete
MEELKPIPVSALNKAAKQLLEDQIGPVLVIGEVSNLMVAKSGHCYFSLKDESAQVSCVFFKQNNFHVEPFNNGDQIQVLAKVTLYEPRGTYQCIVSQIIPAGYGQKQAEFEALKKKLLLEGLFDESKKQIIPRYPQRVGVVSSPSGAAIHDFIQTLKLRMPMIEIILFPALVQGEEAPKSLINALNQTIHYDCDVIVVTRGGGSTEDLWAFNDEAFVRAMASIDLPLVSAVGHEIDVTLSDLVADKRAATPTAAAELISVESQTLIQQLEQIEFQLNKTLQRSLAAYHEKIYQLSKRLMTPEQRISLFATKILHIKQQLHFSIQRHLARLEQSTQKNTLTLFSLKPNLLKEQELLKNRLQQLHWLMEQCFKQKEQMHSNLIQKLNLLSPMQTLERGYGIVSSNKDKAITSIKHISQGDSINIQLSDGTIETVVQKTSNH